LSGIGLALVVGGSAGLLALGCVVFPTQAAAAFTGFARALDTEGDASAGEFMLRTLPEGAVPVVVLSLVTAVLLWIATRSFARAGIARYILALLIVGDLLVRAWGINPVFDPRYLAEPAWISHTRADPHSRVYVGGKQNGALTTLDIDASRGYLNAPGLTGSASRAALSTQAAYYPSAWKTREMLSFDLAVLWPRVHAKINERLMTSSRQVRDRFLDRTGVRYRILPERQAGGRQPIVPIPQFFESFLFDWGDVTPRAAVVSDVRVVPEVRDQVEALFEPGWDSRTTALVERLPEAAGESGPPVTPVARFVADTSNRVVVEAGAAAGGGYLVLLDSYSPDWRVTVDGQPAAMVRANGLFRAVRLNPGRHLVEFTYRPQALVWGAAVSGLALLVTFGLLAWGGRRRRPAEGVR
ncbi:MAG: YfhO family protein, partial [Vicinamibacterales bacterium]